MALRWVSYPAIGGFSPALRAPWLGGRRLYVEKQYPVEETVYCLPKNTLVLVADPERAEENLRKLEVIGKGLSRFSVQLLKKGGQEHV
jgi:hypothetical protein